MGSLSLCRRPTMPPTLTLNLRRRKRLDSAIAGQRYNGYLPVKCQYHCKHSHNSQLTKPLPSSIYSGHCSRRKLSGEPCVGLGQCVTNAVCSSPVAGVCTCNSGFYTDSAGRCAGSKSLNS